MPFFGNIGAPDLIIIAIIALVIFGPGKLPEVAQSLGRGVREFRKAATDVSESTSLDPAPPTATPAASVPATATAPLASPATPAIPGSAATASEAAPPAATTVEPPQGDAAPPSA